MASPFIADEKKTFIKSCFDMEPAAAAQLYLHNLNHDGRNILPRIDSPVLTVGGACKHKVLVVASVFK